MTINKYIYIKLNFIGYHRWPNACAESNYLKHKHRHTFTLKVKAKVTHCDRDIEYHVLQRKTFQLLSGLYPLATTTHGIHLPEFDIMTDSCEHICENLFDAFKIHNIPVVRIECAEDNENGSILELSE